MIGSLRGTLAFKQAPLLVVDVQGVGYEVQAPMSTFYELPEPGSELTLLTHLVVREDAQELYGFLTPAERDLFRSLLKISGVGARLALSILSGMSVTDFVACVQHNDADSLVRLPGVGKKTAGRLLVEMRDRIGAFSDTGGTVTALPGTKVVHGEAYSALIALGYRAPEVARMLKNIDTDGRSTEEIIRQALRNTAET